MEQEMGTQPSKDRKAKHTPTCGKDFEALCNLPTGHKGMCGFECPDSFEAHMRERVSRWAVGALTSRGWIIYERSTERFVAFVVDSHSGNDFRGRESEEHAHLIAAAPELLEALKVVLNEEQERLYRLPVDGPGVSEQKDIHSMKIGRYRALIAKAEGRQ